MTRILQGFAFLWKLGLLLSKPHRGYQIYHVKQLHQSEWSWQTGKNRNLFIYLFIYLFILATCPAHGDGDDTVKSNFLVMIFYAAFGNTLTALLRQAKIFWPFVRTVSIYFVHCWGPGYPVLRWSPNRHRNDTDPEMIPISLHIIPEMIPN